MLGFKILFGIILLSFTFVTATVLGDSIENWQIRRNLQFVEPGMTESDLRSLLGEPTCMTNADIGPREYWSFGKDSFTDNPDFCGSVLIEMSAPPRTVRKVIQ